METASASCVSPLSPPWSTSADTYRLKFGPISMTVASMAIISLELSILDLPREMKPFFILFSRLTIVAGM